MNFLQYAYLINHVHKGFLYDTPFERANIVYHQNDGLIMPMACLVAADAS